MQFNNRHFFVKSKLHQKGATLTPVRPVHIATLFEAHSVSMHSWRANERVLKDSHSALFLRSLLPLTPVSRCWGVIEGGCGRWSCMLHHPWLPDLLLLVPICYFLLTSIRLVTFCWKASDLLLLVLICYFLLTSIRLVTFGTNLLLFF